MNEEQDGQDLKVNDKRRFDMDGNARPSESKGPESSVAPARDPVIDAQAPDSPIDEGQPGGGAQVPSLSAEEVSRLQTELEAARRRVDELARAYQSGERDREEFKQRLTREREQLLDVERGKIALMVIESIDELDLCLQASGGDGSPLAQGVRLIRNNLVSRVQASGIEKLELVGRSYDPNFAEAVDMEVTADPQSDGTVVAELRAGYRLKSRVIRPARVKIAKYVRPAEA